MENAPRRILALSDGKPGHFHQTQGIVNALPDCEATWIEIRFRAKHADNALRAKVALRRTPARERGIENMLRTALTPDSFESLKAVESADAVISAGSSVAAPNLLIAKALDAASVVCARPSPIGVRPFDLSILPRHQWRYDPGNAVRTLGVPTHITPELVAERAAAMNVEPTIGLLFGGNDRRYTWTIDRAQQAIEALTAIAGRARLKIAIATSRRTPPDVEPFLRARIEESPICAYCAFASDPQPKREAVLTILAMSAWVVVTVDSFSMVCEAASSGKPVALIEIPARRPDRYAVAYDAIAERTGMMRMRLDTLYEMGHSLTKSPPIVRPLSDAQTAAEGVGRLLDSR